MGPYILRGNGLRAKLKQTNATQSAVAYPPLSIYIISTLGKATWLSKYNI